LQSWFRQSPSEAPDKIIFMLTHQYPQAKLSGSMLKGRDAHILAVMDGLAKEIGFCLGLANITHWESGPEAGGGYHDEIDEDEIQEVEEDMTQIENLVNVLGKPILTSLDFDDNKETIPRLEHFFKGKKWDEYEHEEHVRLLAARNFETLINV
jgi:hypothetical protein